jgi:hypothetical protein
MPSITFKMFVLLPLLTVGAVPLESAADVTSFASSIKTANSALYYCPPDISYGSFEFPHPIIPTSKLQPDKAFGPSNYGLISPTMTTYFKFDIPLYYTGGCSLIFQFPYASDTAPSAGTYNFTGTEAEIGKNGGIGIKSHVGNVVETTTWNTAPQVYADFGKIQIIPGNTYTISRGYCEPGTAYTFSLSSVGGVALEYMQNYGNQAIGLYTVPCST